MTLDASDPRLAIPQTGVIGTLGGRGRRGREAPSQKPSHYLRLETRRGRPRRRETTRRSSAIIHTGSGLAIIVAAMSFLRDEGVTRGAGVVLTAGSLLMALSLLAGVWSFMPATSTPHWMRLRVGDPRPDDNLYYFGHAAKYAPGALAEAVARRYERQPEPAVSELHRDLAAQLVVNARITLQKLRLFRWAVLLFAGGAILAAAGMLVVVLA